MAITTLTENNFKTEVLQETRPVLVDFWATWCPPCRMVSPIIDEISNERLDIKVCKVNVDEQPGLAVEYGIANIPTLIIFNNGKVSRKIIGARKKNELINWIDDQ